MEINKIKFETDGGPFIFHNYPCPYFYETHHAVYDMNTGVFNPSWKAQSQGWQIVKADSFLKKMILRFFFGSRFY